MKNLLSDSFCTMGILKNKFASNSVHAAESTQLSPRDEHQPPEQDSGSQTMLEPSSLEPSSLEPSSLDYEIRSKYKLDDNKSGRKFLVIASAAILASVSIISLLAVAYSIEQWETVHYVEDLVMEVASENENVTFTHATTDYFVFHVKEDSGSFKLWALPELTYGGLWASCSPMKESTYNDVKSQGIQWLQGLCVPHSSLGLVAIDFSSEKIVRHSLTRVGQSCIIVSTVCLITSVTLGFISIFFRHPLLSILAATLVFSSGAYQIFTTLLIYVRAEEAHHLSFDELPLHIGEASEITFGVSWYANLTALILSMVSGFLWILYSQHAIKFNTFRSM